MVIVFDQMKKAGVAGNIRPIMLDTEAEGLFVHYQPDRENFGFYFAEWNDWPEWGGNYAAQPDFALYLDSSEDSERMFKLVKRLHGKLVYAIRRAPEPGRVCLIDNLFQQSADGYEAMELTLRAHARLYRGSRIAESFPLPEPDPLTLRLGHWRRAMVRAMGEYNFARIQESG
jgi:hypothetical protein